MNTTQINAILSTDSKAGNMFVGTYSWDKVPNLPNGTACVINTHCSSKPVQHWVVYIHNHKKLMFFDSYGNHPLTYPDLPAKIDDYNHQQIQNFDSGVCGQWCVYVLLNIARGRTLEETLSKFGPDYHANDHFVGDFVNQVYGLDLEVHAINNRPLY